MTENPVTATENPAEQLEKAKLLASLSLSKIKIFSKQKAQTQTKSKQSLISSLDFKIFKIILKGDRYSLK